MPTTTDRDQLREAIRRTLNHRAGRAPEVSAGPEASLDTWHQVVNLLAPLIGERGVDVLLGRALLVTSNAYPWLARHGGPGHDEPLAAFLARLEAHDVSAAAEATHALLVTFTELLADLIGAPLTKRLLAPVWASLPRKVVTS